MRHPSEMVEARAAGRPISVVTCYDAWSAKILAASRVDALPAVPEGDIAAGIEPAARVTLRLGSGLDGLDRGLRGWTVASVGLVLVAVAIGWTLWPG